MQLCRLYVANQRTNAGAVDSKRHQVQKTRAVTKCERRFYPSLVTVTLFRIQVQVIGTSLSVRFVLLYYFVYRKNCTGVVV